MRVTLFGVPGNMGSEVLKELVNEDYISKINLLVHDKKGLKPLLKILKNSGKKYRIVYGSVADLNIVLDALGDSHFVVNMAAVIPPKSDKEPLEAIEANEIGPQIIVKAIESLGENQPKLIHISTIGVYGDRTYKHPYAEVGDPLLISPFDLYALTKLRGEYTVLESNIKNWTVIRQAAMLYDDMLMKNSNDGLMFHTCFNTPLEWSTAKTSAVLIRNIIRRDNAGELDEKNFWKHCFNIGGLPDNRITGYDTIRLGFRMLGAVPEQFYEPNYNVSRNFHGSWYSDSYKLNDLFDYQHETVDEFWKHVEDTHKYFKLGKLAPKKVLKYFAVSRLQKDSNAPYYWKKHGDEAKMLAYYNGLKKFNSIPKDWKDFPIISKNQCPDGGELDFEALKANITHLDHYFDINKDPALLNIEDLKKYAKARGGKLLTKDFEDGDIYRKVEWQNHDGDKFLARPYSVLYCGHWMNASYISYGWDFDRIAKFDKLVAQVWYDTHEKEENRYYWYDNEFRAHYKAVK